MSSRPKRSGHLVDRALDGRAVGHVAGEGGGVDLIPRGQLARDALGLVAALRVDDRDMDPFPGQRVADALSEPAIAAGHDGNRAVEVHRFSPVQGSAAEARSRRAVCNRRPGSDKHHAEDGGRPLHPCGQFSRIGSLPSQFSAASRTWSKMRMRVGVASAISTIVPGWPSLRK